MSKREGIKMAKKNIELEKSGKKTIKKSIELLTGRGTGYFEIRILKTKVGTISGYYDMAHIDTAIVDIRQYDGKYNIYITLNDFDPALLNRSRNILELRAKTTTSNNDITRRKWLLIDFDPNRPSGISATNAEKNAAFVRMIDVYEILQSNEWPEPLLCDSGNGYHLLYPVDLPNNAEIEKLIKKFLSVLDLRFSDINVSIDTQVGKAAQLTKLYGTMACKGDNNNERPHRRSGLSKTDTYDSSKIVTTEQMQAIVAMLPEELKTNGKKLLPKKRDIKLANIDSPPEHLKCLLEQCSFINQWFTYPKNINYSQWFGIGSILNKMGKAGQEAWEDMSRRDYNSYNEDDFPRYHSYAKKYLYGCNRLECSQYMNYIEERELNKNAKPPCGVNTPYDLVFKHQELERYKSATDFSAKETTLITEARKMHGLHYKSILTSNKPGIHLINSPCGIGKSRILAKFLMDYINSDEFERIVWLGGRHNQVDEIENMLAEEAPEMNMVHLKGINSMKDFRCFYQEQKFQAYDKGFNVNIYCQQCHIPEKWACKYNKQFSEAKETSFVLGMHEHLAFVKDIKPQLLVIDENFIKLNVKRFSKEDIEFTCNLLQECADNKEVRFLISLTQKLMDASTLQDIESIFSSVDINKFSKKKLKNISKSCLRYFDDHRYDFADNRFVLPELISILKYISKDSTESLFKDIALTFSNNEYSFSIPIELPNYCPVILLDATGSKDFYETALRRKVEEFPPSNLYIKPHSKLILVPSSKNTVTRLNHPKSGKKELNKILKDLSSIIEEKSYKKPGIITYRKLAQQIKEKLPLCKFEYFFNLRGENKFRDCDALFIIGCPQYPGNAIAEMTQYPLHSDIPFEDLASIANNDLRTSSVMLPAPIKGGAATKHQAKIRRTLFHIKECQLIYDTYCLGELLQAIGRARIYDERDKQQVVYVMTSLESSGNILYDEIWKPVLGRDVTNRRKMYSKKSEEAYLELQKMAVKARSFPTGGKYLTIEAIKELAKMANITIAKHLVAKHHKEYKDKMMRLKNKWAKEEC